jgi:hypothetical protein
LPRLDSVRFFADVPPPPSLSDLSRPELEALLIELFGKVADLEKVIAGLREEIARLKGLKGRPNIKPSGMDKATEPVKPAKKEKRRFRGKVTPRVCIEDQVVKVAVPEGSRFKSRPQQREQQISAKELALAHPAEGWQLITWRENGEAFTSRFARWRVRPVTRAVQPAEEWLLIEWPADEAEPTRYWLSALPAVISFEDLVDRTKLRWRIERDYQDLKQEVGLGHYEGRGWCGLHHDITLCVAAYGFLIAERAIFPPQDPQTKEDSPATRRQVRGGVGDRLDVRLLSTAPGSRRSRCVAAPMEAGRRSLISEQARTC